MSTTQRPASEDTTASVLDTLTLDEIVEAAVRERDRQGRTIRHLVVPAATLGACFRGAPCFYQNLRFYKSSASPVPPDHVRVTFVGDPDLRGGITVPYRRPVVRTSAVYKYDEEVGF